MPVAAAAQQIWGQAAANTAQGAVAMGMQRIGANYDRRQQMKTQAQLMEMQRREQMGIMDYQRQLDMKMWNDTNYAAQMEQMKKAGLNPGLMYGMSGGGATTTGSGGGGFNAPSAGIIETGKSGIMGIDPAETMLKVAQAKLANTQADKLGGVDTENVKADTAVKNQEIENLKQGVQSQKAKQALDEINTKLQGFEAWIKEQTLDDIKTTIHAKMNEALGTAKSAEAQGNISYGTMEEAKDIIRSRAVGVLLENALTQAQMVNTTQGTAESKQRVEESKTRIKEMEEQISTWIQQVAQGWTEQDIDRDRNRIIEELGKLGIAVEAGKKVLDIARDIANPRPGRTPVKGFGSPGKRY